MITAPFAQLAARLVIGVDEAGRGPLAGPVVAGAVVLPEGGLMGMADSKKLTARRRAVLEVEIKARCRWAIGVVEANEIDRINIFAATMKAMTLAVAALMAQDGVAQDEQVHVLVDGNLTPAGRVAEWCWPVRAIVGGDATEPAISAASIIAKTHRDRIMHALAEAHPLYGWQRNAGYGTPEHMDALARLGPTAHHRRSFAPVARAALNFPKG
jgi:ribonuclease HII